MREMMRLATTLVIWAVFATVISVMLTNSTGAASRMDGGQLIAVIAILTVAATISTRAIWTDREENASTNIARGKTKRAGGDRIERLIQALDDDEVYDLEALLLARHEESSQRERRDRDDI